MNTRILFILLVFHTSFAFAQKTRNQRCATDASPRQRYVPQVSRYADMEFGIRKAFMYKHEGQLDDHYAFVSTAAPYACISYSIGIFGRFELYTGAEVFLNRPGLKFTYTEGGNTISERLKQGVIGARLLAGLSCNIQQGWKLTAAPALIFASNWEYSHTGSTTSVGSAGYSYKVRWDDQGFHDNLYMGLDLQTEHFIVRSLYFNAGLTVEFDSCIPFGGEVEIAGSNNTRNFIAKTKPYLVNVNAGFSYRFAQRNY